MARRSWEQLNTNEGSLSVKRDLMRLVLALISGLFLTGLWYLDYSSFPPLLVLTLVVAYCCFFAIQMRLARNNRKCCEELGSRSRVALTDQETRCIERVASTSMRHQKLNALGFILIGAIFVPQALLCLVCEDSLRPYTATAFGVLMLFVGLVRYGYYKLYRIIKFQALELRSCKAGRKRAEDEGDRRTTNES